MNTMNIPKFILPLLGAVLLIALTASLQPAHAQVYKWMTVGSLQNWFSSEGCEEEEGFIKEQQYGLRWPAIYNHEDMQAAKAMWIAAGNITYPNGTTGPQVVHIGPRVHGYGEMIPVKMELVSKYPVPSVNVDGNPTEGQTADVDRVDPTIPSDRMIVNVDNTMLGITMVRKIMQFSQQYHDNYMVYDYTFTNTGNTSTTDTTTLGSAKTLTGVYIYFLYRYAPCADTRYVIGQNPTGWGINTMIDWRGDGQNVSNPFFTDPTNNGINYNIRATYAWHGKYPPFTSYDNIGGPIWSPYYDATDTVGRLGAPQFVGVATLHADKSATDRTDDPGQPSTTDYTGSDEPNTSNNDYTNPVKCLSEYGWITRGHTLPRHADKVGPDGDPAIGTPGGFSNSIGYGPYVLQPGQSIHLVLAEAAAGLSREACVDIGRQFKASNGNTSALITYSDGSKVSGSMTKNNWVYTGRDSLFQAFNRAQANYNANYAIPMPPEPPSTFNVTSLGDRIMLSWDVANPSDPNLKGFDIFRALGRYDSTYHLLTSLGAADRTFNDTSAIRGLSYYYYIEAVGDPALNTGAGNTPTGALISSRYYTQTYIAAHLLRQADPVMDHIRVVPNPFNVNAATNLLYSERDKIGFLNVPAECSVKIFTELGELIRTLTNTTHSGDIYWDLQTSSGQIVVSGIYIAVFEKPSGEKAIRKFVIIR